MGDPVGGPNGAANVPAQEGPSEEQIQQMAQVFSLFVVGEVLETLSEDSI
jgi:hypothetical protein